MSELRARLQELVDSILEVDPQAGTEQIFSCQERHGANRHDGLSVSMIQSSINIYRITACVAVVSQLHTLLTAGRLSIPIAKATWSCYS